MARRAEALCAEAAGLPDAAGLKACTTAHSPFLQRSPAPQLPNARFSNDSSPPRSCTPDGIGRLLARGVRTTGARHRDRLYSDRHVRRAASLVHTTDSPHRDTETRRTIELSLDNPLAPIDFGSVETVLVSKDVTVLATLNLEDGRNVQKTIVVTLERAAAGSKTGRWVVVRVTDAASAFRLR